MAAFSVGSVRVDMSINAGEFVRGSRQVQAEYKSMASRISELSARINTASIYITTGMFAARKFAAASGAVTEVAAAFEKGMTNISTLIDTSTESMDAMGEKVLEVSRNVPVSLQDLTTALYDIRSAGISAADSMQVLEGSAKLAVAGLGTSQEAVDLVTSSINAFQLKGAEAARVYDVIFKTVRSGKTTISGLAQGFGAVAGTVANAGIKLDDYLASVAALTTTGNPAAQAHTQLRAAIAGLTRESEIGNIVFKELGVKTFKELIDKSGSLGVAFGKIAALLKGNDAAIIKLLGSVEAYNAIVGIAGSQNAIYNSTLASMRDGTDAVGEAFAKQDATIWAAHQRMTNALQNLAQAFGMALKPSMETVTEKIIELVNWFKSLSPETQQMIAKIGAFAAIIVPAITAIGFFANALAALIPVFISLSGIVAAAGVTIGGLIAATGPIGWFILAASTLLAAWVTFENGWKPLITRVKDVAVRIFDIIAESMKRLNSAILFALKYFTPFSIAVKALEAEMVPAVNNVTEVAKTVPGAFASWTPVITEAVNQTNLNIKALDLEGMQKAAELHKKALADAKQIIEEIQTPNEKLIAQQLRIKAAFDAGGLSAEQYGIAMSRAAWASQNAYAGMASNIASSLQQAFGENKAVAIAAAIVNSYEAFTKALATYPPPFSYAAAAAALAAGFAQVAAIRRTTKSSTGGTGGSGGGAAAANPNVGGGPGSAPQTLTVEGLRPGQLFTGGAVRDLAAKLRDFQKDGGTVIIK